ncbi:hypothetical protein G6F19_012901 [Rhizopus arrhizus]|nr:hypothetical protein G6F19_012901 [Rhizopus arrhizus]KAG0867254.1 hypothetical protein G6F15_012449 [Rhizopus arrhizus]
MYGYEPKTPFDIDNRVFEKSSHKFETVLWHRTTHQIHNLNWVREQSAQAIKQTQAAQKKAIENKILDERKELKPPFRLGDMVLLYKDYMSTSWSGKLQDKWEGPYIIQNNLGKGTYHIKNTNPNDTRIRRVHGNRLKPYVIPNTMWNAESERNVSSLVLDKETNELFQEQAKITVEKMAKDIQEGNGNAADHIKWLLQDYFKPLYVARRTNGLRDGLELYINYMENEEGLKNFEFFIGEEAITKKDYIDKLVLKIQQEVDKEEFEDMIANPEKYEKPIEYGVNYNEDILTELENWSWETPDMKPIVVLYEENIKEEFELSQHYQKEQEKFEHIREQVLNRLATTIVDWSHIKFEKPRNNERSIQLYVAARNEALRFVLNGCTIHKNLYKKIRKLDDWGRVSMLEDEQAVVAGICNEDYNINTSNGCGL